MNEGLITNLRSPENDNDATSKKYVDDSLIESSASNITSTPTMTSNSTTINGLTYTTVASSMLGGQRRAWRAFTNEVVTRGSPASNLGWLPSNKDATPWIQMQYPSGIIVTSFNIFIRNGSKNITLWNVQGGNNPGGSEFTTLIASTVDTTMQLNANNYYSILIIVQLIRYIDLIY